MVLMGEAGRGLRVNNEDTRQQHGFFFEMCKHLTTLDTAALLVVLAMHEELSAFLFWSLLLFGVSLFFSTIGMLVVALAGTSIESISRATNFLLLGSVTFLTGVLVIILWISS
jgi:hypothetical protein